MSSTVADSGSGVSVAFSRSAARRSRSALARASRAPRDPAWIADGVIADHWAPVSPVTGRLDAFVWTTPTEITARTLEHADPKELIASMRSHEAEVMRLLGEIEELVCEVQA